MKQKNMKIEINDEQPLDEVVKELERMGAWLNMDDGDNTKAKWVLLSMPSMRYDIYNDFRHFGDWAKTTTLQQLREMK